MSEDGVLERGMLTLTSDVFILNGFVYWRRIRTNFHTKKGYSITQTSRDEYIRIKYKGFPTKFEFPEGTFHEVINLGVSQEFITSNTFREEQSKFEDIKNVPEYIDTLFGDVLEHKWLANILYTSTIMVFDQ